MFPAPRPAPVVVALAAATVLLAACSSNGSSAPSASVSRRASFGASVSSSAPVSSTASVSSGARSSSASSSTGASALVRSANRICRVGNEYRTAHPFPYPRFDSSKPEVADLPGVAAYLRREPDVVGRLLGLDLPLDVATALTRVRANAHALVAAAEDGDARTFARTAEDRAVLGRQLYVAAKPSGLDAATACLTYFEL